MYIYIYVHILYIYIYMYVYIDICIYIYYVLYNGSQCFMSKPAEIDDVNAAPTNL